MTPSAGHVITWSHLKQKNFLAQAVYTIVVFWPPVLIKRLLEVMGIIPTVLVAAVCAMVIFFPEQGNCKCSFEPNLLHRYSVLGGSCYMLRKMQKIWWKSSVRITRLMRVAIFFVSVGQLNLIGGEKWLHIKPQNNLDLFMKQQKLKTLVITYPTTGISSLD